MKWLDSTGGPMVVVPADHVGQWSGHRGNDYDLACSVDDVGVVSVTRDGTAFAALSLWGEPLSTTYLTDLDCVVQWRWAANEGELLNDLRSAWEELEWTLIGAVWGLGKVRMFDASIPGDELERGEFIGWSIDCGEGSIVTAELDAGESACRLIRVLGGSVGVELDRLL